MKKKVFNKYVYIVREQYLAWMFSIYVPGGLNMFSGSFNDQQNKFIAPIYQDHLRLNHLLHNRKKKQEGQNHIENWIFL